MELIHFGNIVASFGVDGTMVIAHAFKKKVSLQHCKAVFIETSKGVKNPYFIKKSKAININDLHLNIDEVNTKEATKAYLKKKVWLTKENFDALVDASAPIALLGYMVIEKGKPIGEIIEVIEQPHQLLCNINYKGKQAFIPIHSETLVGIDRVKQMIEVDLPDGLLDIYS
jgi:16S rRNA processing protein RimM